MISRQKAKALLEAAIELLTTELATDNKDPFTKSYLEKRVGELKGYLEGASERVSKAQLLSAKNVVSNLKDAIDQISAYDDAQSQFYKAAVGDLKDELETACEAN